MNDAPQNDAHQIAPGITVTPAGQATVDPSLADVLFDLAIALEEQTELPVDVEHVLGAIILAARGGEIAPDRPITTGDDALINTLAVHVTTIFAAYDGKVGQDD